MREVTIVYIDAMLANTWAVSFGPSTQRTVVRFTGPGAKQMAEGYAELLAVNQPALGPPFDDIPCLACPSIVRVLHASARNLLDMYRRLCDARDKKLPSQVQLEEKLQEKMVRLEKATNAMEPAINKHFVSQSHSQGEQYEAGNMARGTGTSSNV